MPGGKDAEFQLNRGLAMGHVFILYTICPNRYTVCFPPVI